MYAYEVVQNSFHVMFSNGGCTCLPVHVVVAFHRTVGLRLNRLIPNIFYSFGFTCLYFSLQICDTFN
jgi:hypothetical protein